MQRSAFGHGIELNQKRANVAYKAIALHQVWVASAYNHFKLWSKEEGVLQHISKTLTNSISDPKASKVMWQWLFMFIPVVSSTFASVARQFSKLDKEDIGWLFVDEAGQASPQQAVGAFYRAKRVVVVGDPLQIEPVFTIPPEFVEGFAKEMLGEEEWRTWSPTKTSVQRLADRVNRYGTQMIAKGEWLGSPLRVHRRCDEPMFSIANKVAYNEKMFHGNESPEGEAHHVWGKVHGLMFPVKRMASIMSLTKAAVWRRCCLPITKLLKPYRMCTSSRHLEKSPMVYAKLYRII
ncbi:RNA helicase family protein [Vibrio cholerae]|nr:RNA helicase family protein [Vibrio cholerae]